MVKAVVGEEAQLKLTEDRLSSSSIPAQVGLVIGKLSSSLDRGFVFSLIATPPNDEGRPACSLVEPVKDDKRKGAKQSKSQASSDSSSLVIDKDWVAEHARQVSKMLVGGVRVIGIFVWASESAFKNSTIEFCQTIKGVAGAAQPLSGTDTEERLLIHISYSPRRWICRNCVLASNITSSSLKPCDFKMGRVLNSLRKFKCTYNFNMRLPVRRESASDVQKLGDVLHSGISVMAKELRSARAVVDGNLVTNDATSMSEGFHDVELLLPFMNDTYLEASSLENVIGVLLFSGSVCSFAFLSSKESILQAIADIKADIITSLRSRLDIILDEADADLRPLDNECRESGPDIQMENLISQVDLQSLRKPSGLLFPRRVFAPWLAGMFICDYLQPSETLEVLKDHCAELMSMEVLTDSSDILEPEGEAPSVVAKCFWDVASPSRSDSKSLSEKVGADPKSEESNEKSNKQSNLSTVAAILVLLLSVLLGYLFLSVRAS
ncbi:protein odr-4 homolog [Rhodamnia argentea]|uniref:Protein odr-4 homolog n=1 Tax=Rhodamnia argentea TaxID=178133 RepID=A0A8B8P1K6_9MYRT|nr:protein odr-4 homolog [Rhodamnia argentea]XP_030528715.1 protein odr-4 homolog [Rhodamnia argentea]XP_048131226.1 protein odr-4 homolog [Rhodamnia argentea]